MRFPTMWYVQPAKPKISLLCKSLEYSMSVKLLTEHHLEFLSLKGGCTGSLESTLVKIPILLEITCQAQLYSEPSNICCNKLDEVLLVKGVLIWSDSFQKLQEYT